MSEDLPHSSGIKTYPAGLIHGGLASEDLPHSSGIKTQVAVGFERGFQSEDLPYSLGLKTFQVASSRLPENVGRRVGLLGINSKIALM